MDSYNIDFNSIKNLLLKKKARKILVQLPEGLKQYHSYIAGKLKGFELLFHGDPCFGACDIPQHIRGVDIILHFGHAPIPNLNIAMPIHFVEMHQTVEVASIAQQFLHTYNCHSVGLLATVQYLEALNQIKLVFEKNGISTFVGKGDSRIAYDGQVLGCNFSAAHSVSDKVECFVLVSTGNFHGIGIELSTGKKTYIFDPVVKKIRSVSKQVDAILRQRYVAVEHAEHANTFGLLVSTKIGQFREKYATYIKNELISHQKKVTMIYMDLIDPSQLLNYNVDVFVSFACPRIAIDDWAMFNRPILTPIEVEIALGLRDITSLVFDEIVYVD